MYNIFQENLIDSRYFLFVRAFIYKNVSINNLKFNSEGG